MLVACCVFDFASAKAQKKRRKRRVCPSLEHSTLSLPVRAAPVESGESVPTCATSPHAYSIQHNKNK